MLRHWSYDSSYLGNKPGRRGFSLLGKTTVLPSSAIAVQSIIGCNSCSVYKSLVGFSPLFEYHDLNARILQQFMYPSAAPKASP